MRSTKFVSGAWASVHGTCNAQSRCSLQEPAVQRPQRHVAEERRSQQVHIDPTKSAAHQSVRLDECERTVIIDGPSPRQGAEQRLHFGAPTPVATGKLADDEVVAENLLTEQQLRQSRISSPQVVDPHRGVDECSSRLRQPPAANRRQPAFAAAQGCEALCAGARDECFETRVQ